jgi:hypothetical protein
MPYTVFPRGLAVLPGCDRRRSHLDNGLRFPMTPASRRPAVPRPSRKVQAHSERAAVIQAPAMWGDTGLPVAHEFVTP